MSKLPTLLTASLLFALSVSVPSHSCGADGTWQAGAGRQNITPTELMWMSGYGGRDHAAEGKLTELWAKALVLQDGGQRRGVLVTLDLVGIDRTMSEQITGLLGERFGFPREAVMICASHTHTGPVVGTNLAPLHYYLVDSQQQNLIKQYASQLPEKIAAAVQQAVDAMQPCRLSWGNGQASFAVNRRNNAEPQVPMLRRTGNLVGPVDHDVPVLAVRDLEGTLKAVVFGYACHATVLSFYQWSADYPGFAQEALEAAHPGCVALFYSGCGADQNPLPRRTVELAKHYGQRLATAVDAVLLTSDMESVAPRWKQSYREIDLQLDELPSREQLVEQTQSSNRYEVARARYLLQKLEEEHKLSSTYSYPIGFWQLGDEVQWIFLGGEVVVDYALRLKAELRGPRTWVAGYANDVMAYIPSRRVLAEGGYEGGGSMVYYGLPTLWAPQVEEDIVQAVHDLTR